MDDALYPALPILLVDDEQPWLRSMALSLRGAAGFNNVLRCDDSRQVMELLARQEVGVVVMDLNMPHLSGAELLPQIARDHPEVPVIVLSGMNQLETAVDCMRLGAFDYFIKATEEERLVAGIRRALSFRELQRENRVLHDRVLDDALSHPELFAEVITQSRKMHLVFQYLEAVAGSPEPLLITGESGTGKELAAKAAHRLGRPGEPFVAVNVAGLDDNVFADTLFGHSRGAFTGAERERPGMIEAAAAGTLFLDEVGDLSPASQVKLLRLLQEGEYFPLGSDKPRRCRARLLFATNQDLQAKQAAGTFRSDLFYRLRAHHLPIPPLRERPEDIPLLLDFFLGEAARALGKKKPTPPAELPVLLATYHFPGNVRELRAMVYDAVSLHRSKKLSMAAFKRAIGQSGGLPAASSPSALPLAKGIVFPDRLPTIAETTGLLVAEALRRSKGNQRIAAGLLGVSQQALSKRLAKAKE